MGSSAWSRVFIIVVLSGLVLVAPTRTAALSCAASQPAELVQRATVIATGSIVSAPPPPNPPGGRYVTVRADRYYKGQLGPGFSIWHNENVGPDIRFQPGYQYLIFLRQVDGVWRTSLCDGTREVAAGIPADLQALLGPGAAPDPGVAKPPQPPPGPSGSNAAGGPVAAVGHWLAGRSPSSLLGGAFVLLLCLSLALRRAYRLRAGGIAAAQPGRHRGRG